MALDAVTILAVAFAGGVFGASVGGVTAFAVCGVAATLGVVVRLAGGGPEFDHVVTWGPFLGPQAAFVGAVGAAAFAARRGKLESGRDVLSPLAALDDRGVLAVGGACAVGGQGLWFVFERLNAGLGARVVDPMALAVVSATLAIRLIFGTTGLLGARRPGERLLALRADATWLPWQSAPSTIVLLAVSVAVPAAWIAQLLPAASGIVFGVSAASLLLFVVGRQPPVTLHMALAASTAAAAWGGFLVPVGAAIGCGLVAEGAARSLLVRGDTHVDPPALAIALTTTALAWATL